MKKIETFPELFNLLINARHWRVVEGAKVSPETFEVEVSISVDDADPVRVALYRIENYRKALLAGLFT